MSQPAYPAHRPRWYLWLFLSLVLAWSVSFSPAAVTAAELPAVVATVQDVAISTEELTAALQGELMRLELERYKILKQKLDEMIADRLLQLEAAKRGVAPQQLEQEEILAKATPVSAEQIKAFYAANTKRLANGEGNKGERRLEKKAGKAGTELPEDFRKALDSYNRGR